MPKGFALFLMLLVAFNLGSCSSSSSVVVKEAWRQTLDSPTTYTVKKSDTLYSIAWNYGLDYRQVAISNKIKPPYHIQVGQKLHLENLSLPRSIKQPKIIKAVVTNIQPRTPDQSFGSSALPAEQEEIPTEASSAEEIIPPIQQIKLKTEKKSGIIWAWPTHQGRLIQYFSCTSLNKGIDILGKAGTPVLAAAAGKIVYAGNGLRGYGEMLIVKHSDEFLSAYAHNQKLLVREGQSVKVGQVIALMGDTESRRVLLHFEIRQTGKPVDPLNYLPRR